MTDAALSVDFVVLAGKDENRWIRLEQVGQEEQAITFAEAAELIDELYGTSPCNGDESSEGTGGEAASEPALDEESFLNLAATRLRILSCFPNTGFWPVEVDVLRSHREGDWRLSSDVAEIGGSVVVTGTKTEVVELENAASYDLNYPYGGDLRVSGAVAVDVRGSTVNFARPVTGRVRLTYTAVWDRVSVKVPAKADKNGIYRADPAAVICFWERLAAPLTLEQPEDDATLAAIVHVCPRYRFKHEGDCYERVEHYSLCNCSGREDGEMTWEEMVEAPCPDGTAAGSVVARRRELDGYVECPDEEDRLHDPEFFAEKCCGEPEGLPRCTLEREAWGGGEEIEGGPEHYREIYGGNVRLTAVVPEGGKCGELVREWSVVENSANGTGPPTIANDSIVVRRRSSFFVEVSDGKLPLTWITPPDVTFKYQYNSFSNSGVITVARFEVGQEFTGGVLTVEDACHRKAELTMTVPLSCGWVEIGLSEWPDEYKIRVQSDDDDFDGTIPERIGFNYMDRKVFFYGDGKYASYNSTYSHIDPDSPYPVPVYLPWKIVGAGTTLNKAYDDAVERGYSLPLPPILSKFDSGSMNKFLSRKYFEPKKYRQGVDYIVECVPISDHAFRFKGATLDYYGKEVLYYTTFSVVGGIDSLYLYKYNCVYL